MSELAHGQTYVATHNGCSFGTPMGYRVWLVDRNMPNPKDWWIREVTVEDLHHLDAVALAERLNRESHA